MVNKWRSSGRFLTIVALGAMTFLLLVFALNEGMLARRGISIELEEFLQSSDAMDIHLKIPNINGAEDPLFQETINALFRYQLMSFAYELDTLSREHHGDMAEGLFQYAAYSDYESYFYGDILSLAFVLYQYTGGAHGLSVKASYTMDLKEREFLSLSQLFEEESYREVIQEEIERQIRKNRGDYFDPLTDLEFDEENFYLSEEGVHIYYQLYSIAPYAKGIPVFLIPWEMLEEPLL